MIKLIIKRFIKDYKNTNDTGVRQAYGVLSGVLGVICNLFLFAVKITVGLFINSIAVISDAFNNFSDFGSCVIVIFGAKLSGRPKDKEHPYGHGRYEYIASLIVAFVIFGVGLELIRSSVEKIIHPERVVISTAAIIILIASVGVKVWMYFYNKYIGGVINSSVNRAAAYDSLSDIFATGGVIAGAVAGSFTTLPIDGIIGLIVSLLIMYSGFKISKDSVSLLLGAAPDPELVEKINAIVLSGSYIKGAHDLEVHDYGPGRINASLHAEVTPGVGIVDIHDEIDKIERQIEAELGVHIVIHMDPSGRDAE